MAAQVPVSIRLRFKESQDGPAGECMWAEPVDLLGAGTYRLLNCSFFVPLAVGDIVRTEIDGGGTPQIVDFVTAGRRILTVVMYGVETSVEEAKATADRWITMGDAWTEGSHGVLHTIWGEGVPLAAVTRSLEETIGGNPAYKWVHTSLPEDRSRRALESDVDFQLERWV